MQPLIVVGSAPCLFDDLARANRLFPGAALMLVNGAALAVECAEHVLAGHASQADELAAARHAKFPGTLPWRMHASWPSRRPRPPCRSVTDWWGAEMSSGATSAGKAVLIGLAMGHGPIILAGAPMDGSGYFAGDAVAVGAVRGDASCQRVGDPRMQQRRTIIRYREKFRERASQDWTGIVFSMSGFTRECLPGSP